MLIYFSQKKEMQNSCESILTAFVLEVDLFKACNLKLFILDILQFLCLFWYFAQLKFKFGELISNRFHPPSWLAQLNLPKKHEEPKLLSPRCSMSFMQRLALAISQVFPSWQEKSSVSKMIMWNFQDEKIAFLKPRFAVNHLIGEPNPS